MSNIWPFVPQVKMKETMEWMTEILRCKSAEQRVCLRSYPRTFLEYNFHFLPQQIEAATVISRNWGADEFLLPLWTDMDYVGTVSASATTILLNPDIRRYKVGSKAFILGANGGFEEVVISAINAGVSIELEAPGVLYGYAGAVICPLYPARIKSPPQFRKYAAEYFTGGAEFVLSEDFGITALNPYMAYSDAYVVSDRPILSGGNTESHRREFRDFDSIQGPMFYSKLYDYSVSNSSLAWSFDSDTEVWDFRRWMYDLKGKQGSFFAPRWSRDFILTQSILNTDTYIVVSKNSELLDSYLGDFCIVKTDGSQVYLDVISWEYHTVSEYRMNLSGTAGVDINLSEVEMITRMPKYRSNSDRIEFDMSYAGVVDVRIPLMEVPE